MLGTGQPVTSRTVASIEKAKLLITYGMLLCEQGCVPLFLPKKQMFGVIVKPFISPLSSHSHGQ